MKYLYLAVAPLLFLAIPMTTVSAQSPLATPGVCYATSGGNSADLYTIDLLTAATTLVGSSTLDRGFPGLAVDSKGNLYGTSRTNGAPVQTSRLYRIDASDGTPTLVGDTGLYFVDAIAFDGTDVLYGTDDLGSLFTIDLSGGVIDPSDIHVVGATLDRVYSGLSFDPTDGTLFGSTAGAFVPTDFIATIDPLTGIDTDVGTTTRGGGTPDIAFDESGALFGLKGGGKGPPNELISINTGTGFGTPVGTLSVTKISGMTCFNADDGGPVKVLVDIEPQSCPNKVNAKSKGKVKVAVLGTADFDVSTIDVSTLTFAGLTPEKVKTVDVSRPPLGTDDCACTEEGADGYDDLLIDFKYDDILAFLGEVADGDQVSIELTGDLLDGSSISGEDCAVIKVPKEKAKKNEQTDAPVDFALEANYPNPFNPSTTISFVLANQLQVDVSIYNPMGRRIKQIAAGTMSAGRHTVEWHGTDSVGKKVASGLYLYRLSAGEFVQSRKMLLLE